MKTSKFYWNDETVDHFKFMSSYIDDNEVKQAIKDFVEINCTIEGDETEEELANDLFSVI